MVRLLVGTGQRGELRGELRIELVGMKANQGGKVASGALLGGNAGELDCAPKPGVLGSAPPRGACEGPVEDERRLAASKDEVRGGDNDGICLNGVNPNPSRRFSCTGSFSWRAGGVSQDEAREVLWLPCATLSSAIV